MMEMLGLIFEPRFLENTRTMRLGGTLKQNGMTIEAVLPIETGSQATTKEVTIILRTIEVDDHIRLMPTSREMGLFEPMVNETQVVITAMVIAATLIRMLTRIARKSKVMTLALHELPSVPDTAFSRLVALFPDSMTTLGKRGSAILRSLLTM